MSHVGGAHDDASRHDDPQHQLDKAHESNCTITGFPARLNAIENTESAE